MGISPLLDGQELQIPALALRPVPEVELEAILARQTRLEHALALRVWGRLADLRPRWVRDADGLWTTPEALARRECEKPGPMNYFLPDDLGAAVRVLEPGEFHADAVACSITRAPHQSV